MFRGIILFTVSIVCSIIFIPLGVLTGFWKKDYFITVALSIDQTMNVVMSPLFNWILRKKNGFEFGNPDQTISYVIGRNYIDGTLTKFGSFWRLFLDTIEKDHCINAVINES